MKTKRILTNQAKSGMVVAEDIYTYNNQLIISKDTMLTNRAITRLNFYSITDLKIYEEPKKKEDVKPTISFTEEIKQTKEFKLFSQTHEQMVADLKEELNSFVSNKKPRIDIDKLSIKMNQLLAASRNGVHVFHMLQCMRDFNDITYNHSVNVSIICHTIGCWMNLSEKDLQILTLSGLLHDIGKLLVPQDIIEKPSALTSLEYRIIKTHSQKGYELLKEQPIDMRISMSALMHHERCDGTGYPNHIKGNEMLPFAKIVAIADTYDAMTSSRIYRGAMCPFEVINMYETEGLQKFDPEILLVFLQNMAATYIHNNVLLSNGQKGKIVLLNNPVLSKPIVQVGENFVDLSRHSDLTITKII